MIIYGSRMYWRKNKVQGWGHCSQCGKYVRHTSYNGRRWGHLYFLPLIPIGPRTRVLMECPKCGHGLHVPEAKAPEMLTGIQASADAALAALVEGKIEFIIEGKGRPASCVRYLADAVELLYGLDSAETVAGIIKTLADNGETYAHEVVRGSAFEFQGRFDEAVSCLQRGMAAAPQKVLPLVLLAALQEGRGKVDDARLLYEKALEFAPDDLSLMQALLGIYAAAKDHRELAQLYERCFGVKPALKKDKKLVKAYTKACKKVGKRPIPVV